MKTFCASLLALFLVGNVAFATTADDYTFNETEFYTSFETLDEIDQIVGVNEDVTLADIKEMDGVSENAIAAATFMAKGDAPLGIPAFFWGCVLGWVGILITYLLTDHDKEQTKKALFGCLTWTGVVIVFYVVYFIVILGSI